MKKVEAVLSALLITCGTVLLALGNEYGVVAYGLAFIIWWLS